MNILIAGAGEVGFELGKVLSEEGQNVTVLDERENCLARVNAQLDVLTVQGNATSPNALVEAGAKTADLMVAVTSSDEVNIIASMMAKKLGVKKVIARVRNDELSKSDSPIPPSDLGIDLMIHPEEAAASEIYHLIRRASASDVVSLANNRLQLIGLRVEKDADVSGYSLEDLSTTLQSSCFRVVAIARRGRTIIPRGSNRLMPFDHIFVVAKTAYVKELVQATGHHDRPLRRILIAGGSELGRILAATLSRDEHNWDIKLIEPDRTIAEKIAENHRDILVLHGNPVDPNLLVSEGIREMDAFISVSEDEESNIISCLLAKHLGVKKTVALVSKSQYVPLSQTIGIDSIVNVKSAASDEIHRQIRQAMFLTVKALHGIKAEIIEVLASDRARILNKTIRTLKLPNGIVIAAILRNGEIYIPTGDEMILQGDSVTILALPEAIPEVERLFG